MRPLSTLSHRGLLAVAAVVVPLLACQPDADPAGPNGPLAASRNGVLSTEGLASPGWQVTAATLIAQAKVAPYAAGRLYSLVGVAQYLAVQRAEAALDAAPDVEGAQTSGDGIGVGGRARLETDRGAVAGASLVVLSYLFPSQAQALEDTVAAQAGTGPGQVHPAFARGEAIGRAVGAEIVTRARTDGFDTPFTGTIPVGPGFWTSNTTPPTVAGGSLPGVLPWFLTSASQFRSAPPPAFGSPAFHAGLAEIRLISDTRTAAQVQIATFWAQGAGTRTTPGFWIQVATDGINQHALSERQATHLYALLSATMSDAQIGCWDAKLTYWFIRPWQADPLITVVAAVGKPNHPSYPSGHSCTSSSAAQVLSAFFPEQRAQLDAMVIEAGLSRMYGGIHYRFDIEAGQQLGRSVARFTIAADKSGHSVLTPDDEEEGDGPR
jgi:membrane-associated phospholipid phosphatase